MWNSSKRLISSHLRQFVHRPFPLLKPFSTASSPELIQSLSSELLKTPTSDDPLSLSQRLHLSFSHVTPSAPLIQEVLNISPAAGRAALGFHKWAISNPNFTPDDRSVAFFVDYFGRKKDFKAICEVLLEMKGVSGENAFNSCVDRFVRAGRVTQLVSFFEIMENDYGFVRSKESLRAVIDKLTEFGYASHAEKMVKSLASEFFPDEGFCDLLVRGWCVDGKLEEARRLAEEMRRGGFEIGVLGYNSILDCVCKVCREKDPFRLELEAEKVLVDMDVAGVPRNIETFNVLIENLCKIRRTEEALQLFWRMGEWGCNPDSRTFLLLTKSLYQAARIGEGDEMIDRMKSAGLVDALDKKAYYGFIKVLCGIERIDHAMSVFGKMKEDGCKPGIKTYELLMEKLCAHGRLDKANVLFNEALKNELPVTPKAYKVDPRFAKKKPKAVKKEKKRETLPEKMARKRRRLKKIRLSFVKKPKKSMQRGF